MNILIILLISLCFVSATTYKNDSTTSTQSKRYLPNWDSLDTRPLPQWYDSVKIGIFLHWGVYSVPAFISEWFWAYWRSGKYEAIKKFMQKNYPPGFTYQDFAPMFKAEFFVPEEWAELFAQSGAKYVVLTSKHHEGYTLFPSKRSFSWNSVEVGPKRDLVGDLAKAVRSKQMKFGVYHSLYEWYNPIYKEDRDANFKTQKFTDTKLLPDIKQLIEDYKPSVLWADGDWDAVDKYWKSEELLAWLYNDSPVKDEIVVNDRWGKGIPGHHGDFFNHADRFNNGTLMDHKWENAFTVDRKAWGFRRKMMSADVFTLDELLYQIASTVSCGGNALINVGPTSEGTISPIFQERLLSVGKWLKVNGEAIYDSSPWTHQNDSFNGKVWYTCSKTVYDGMRPTAKPKENDKISAVYAIFLVWPNDNLLKVADLVKMMQSRKNYKIELLGYNEPLKWDIKDGKVNVQLPNRNLLKLDNAWTLKITSK